MKAGGTGSSRTSLSTRTVIELRPAASSDEEALAAIDRSTWSSLSSPAPPPGKGWTFFDDRLRLQVARAIYRDPVLSRYAMQPLPPIHIIVDNGHITLEGVVSNQMESNVAAIRAQGAGQSFGQVVNNLRVENPTVKK